MKVNTIQFVQSNREDGLLLHSPACDFVVPWAGEQNSMEIMRCLSELFEAAKEDNEPDLEVDIFLTLGNGKFGMGIIPTHLTKNSIAI